MPQQPHDPAAESPAGSTGQSSGSDSVSDGELDQAVQRTLDWLEREQLPAPRGLPEPQSLGLPSMTLGSYRLLGELGRGGMGVVLEAELPGPLARRVAIKVLDEPMPSPRALARFRRESRALGRLDHPNVVPLIEAHGGSDETRPFTVMEFVEGLSLSQLLVSLARLESRPLWASEVAALIPGASPAAPGSRFSGSYIDWVLRLGVSLADGLAHAHSQGVVHRDVKPANIMLTPQGIPVIVDFGLASGEDDRTLTASGVFLGTLPYSPPEQLDGERVDGRSDVYALGVTLYELLAVARPFVAAGRRELLREIESGAGPAPVEGLSSDLLTVLRTAMAAEPARRYQGAAAFARDLAACARGAAIEARAPSWWQRSMQLCRRHPLAVAVLSMALLGSAGLIAVERFRARVQLNLGQQSLARALSSSGELSRCERELARLENPAGLRLMNSADELPALELSVRWAELRAGFEKQLALAESHSFRASSFLGGQGDAEGLMGRALRARIDRSLLEQTDVLERDRYKALLQRLLALDPEATLRAGLARSSPLSVDSQPSGAAFEVVASAGGPLLARGVTPDPAIDLPPGSYLVRLSSPGRLSCTVPVVLRARAAATLAELPPDKAPPWSTVDIALPPLDAALPGWNYIPRGASLIGLERSRWLVLDEFWIQTYEVTLADVLACLNDERADHSIAAIGGTLLKPRFADNLASLEVRQNDDGRWLAGEEVKDLRWPARGLSPDDVAAYVGYLASLSEPRPAGWYLALPTEAEWERAARGADGRRYPWGNDYGLGLCVDARFNLDGDPEPWPAPVGSGLADVSVFGVHDLAGSVAEWTESSFEPQRADFSVRGGSYRDRDTLRLSSHFRRAMGNRPGVDVGFRLVLRKEPRWLGAAPHPSSFRDDFERADGGSVGGGWVELNAMPLAVPADPGSPECCSLAGGRMICQGGLGNNSNASLAWHGLGGSGRVFRLRALLSVEALRSPPTRGAVLSLLCRADRWKTALSIEIHSTGALVLRSQARSDGHRLPDLEGDHWVELSSDGRTATARVWPAAASAPLDSQLAVPLAEAFDQPDFVVVRAANLCGVRLTVDELEFEAEP